MRWWVAALLLLCLSGSLGGGGASDSWPRDPSGADGRLLKDVGEVFRKLSDEQRRDLIKAVMAASASGEDRNAFATDPNAALAMMDAHANLRRQSNSTNSSNTTTTPAPSTTPAPTGPVSQLPAVFTGRPWMPPSITQVTPLSGKVYTVVLYHIPPFVEIVDEVNSAMKDAGNFNGTRSAAQTTLKGFTIDFLGELEKALQVKFRYVYPCLKSVNAATGKCGAKPTKAMALEMVAGGAGAAKYVGGDNFCPNLQCFVAGAVKIDAPTVRKFFVTQSYMEKGFVLVMRSGPVEPGLFSWAEPFSTTLWAVIVAELFLCGIAFMWVEGYGTNDALWDFSNPLGQLFDALYWGVTLILGAADKAPTTHAGRSLVCAQLFFGVLLIALYTGNLSSFLANIPTSTAVKDISNIFDPNSPYYSKSHKICYSSNQGSIKAWLDLQEASKHVTLVNATDFSDCIDMVYKGQATATLFDEPVALSIIKQYYATGKCGTGGYCSASVPGGPDPSQYQDKETCECPPTDKLTNGDCANKYQTKWTSVTGSVVLVGNGFNPFGYGLAFPKNANVSDHVSFGQAINWIKDRGTIEVLSEQYVPDIASLSCSSSVGSGAIVLGFQNIRGLLVVTGVVIFVGVGLGMAENVIWLAMYCFGMCSGKHDEEEMDDIDKLDEELNKKKVEEKEKEEEQSKEKEEKEEKEGSWDADKLVAEIVDEMSNRLSKLESLLVESNQSTGNLRDRYKGPEIPSSAEQPQSNGTGPGADGLLGGLSKFINVLGGGQSKT